MYSDTLAGSTQRRSARHSVPADWKESGIQFACSASRISNFWTAYPNCLWTNSGRSSTPALCTVGMRTCVRGFLGVRSRRRDQRRERKLAMEMTPHANAWNVKSTLNCQQYAILVYEYSLSFIMYHRSNYS
jgi:hypothetical protein